jgi:exopolyphosphatase/guanosine-5'-triphosphate,3'-diphosphate pyrophosphatase
MTPARVLAGIDIGTLTCRLLIARVHDSGRLTELRSDRRILRLGQGVDKERVLLPEAMDRVVATLKEWQQVVASFPVDATAAVATSAVRDAKNRVEFLDRVKREVGWEVELITGEEEARRTMLGIRSGLPIEVTDMLALDIGGGSTEFILDRLGQQPVVRSIDIGVVRLSERFLAHDPPMAQEVEAARGVVRRETEQIIKEMRPPSRATFVGTAGTITALAAMAQRLPAYEPARIHNYALRLETVQDLERELLSHTKDERRGMPGLERGREGVIVSGAVILRTVMEALGYSECLVSDLGLREGVLIDLVKRTGNR